MVGTRCFGCCGAHRGLPVGFLLLWCSVLFAVDSLSLLYRGGASFVGHLCCFCLVLLCFHERLFVGALWLPAGRGLTSWLSFVMSNCGVVTFPLVFMVGCGA